MTTARPEPEERVGFKELIEKVHQAEMSLEAKERQTVANWRQTKQSWRAAWTPGRIVLAGLVGGFMVGRAEPFKHAAGRGTLQLISMLGSLFASGSAQAAAGEAEDAADAAEAKSATTPAAARDAAMQARVSAQDTPPYEIPETFRDSGQL